MIEFIVFAGILILLRFLLKPQKYSSTVADEIQKTPVSNETSIIGKSTFVLNFDRNKQPQLNSSGKLDIDVPLDYEETELNEELEELGVANEASVDLSFEEMMEVVKEVETEKPQKPKQTGKLLYENENADWVEQLAATSENFQKRISGLIDSHLGSLEQNQVPVSDDGIGGFDIGEYVN